MPKFVWDRRLGTYNIEQRPPINRYELFQKIKRQFFHKIKTDNIQDQEILKMIDKVISGTRNVRYMFEPDETRRLQDIAFCILRETH